MIISLLVNHWTPKRSTLAEVLIRTTPDCGSALRMYAWQIEPQRINVKQENLINYTIRVKNGVKENIFHRNN